MSMDRHRITNERLEGNQATTVRSVGAESRSHDVSGEGGDQSPLSDLHRRPARYECAALLTELSGPGNARPTTRAPARQESPRRRYRPRGEPLITRVLAQLDMSGGPDACWPYMGRRNPEGYGVVDQGTKAYMAHRVVLAHSLGRELAPDEVSRHKCNNPPCGNASHLLPGTKADNAADMVAAGRSLRGEKAASAKVTEDQVIKIRQMAAVMGWGKYELLGRSFGVTGKQISNIVKGKRWAHVGASR